MVRIAAVALLAAVVAACTSAPRGGERVARNVITAAEIASTTAATAYEAVRQLRPAFLQQRTSRRLGGEPAARPIVYVDGIRMGGLDALHRVHVSDVLEIRYLSAHDATTRYGTGHTGGVIEVRSRS
jgi:hypothetical protein